MHSMRYTGFTGWLRASASGGLLLGFAGMALPAGANVFVEPGVEIFEFASTSNTRDLALGDMDGDGDLDLVVGAWNTSFRVWLNDGAGNFSDNGFNEAGNGTFVNDLELADFDGDGDLDVLQVRGGNADSQLWFNDGSGGLTNAGQDFPTGNQAAVGDFNADGAADLVFGDGSVYLNDGSGQFNLATSLSPNVNVAAGDVDGDGDVDIVTAAGSSSRVYFNDGVTPLSFTTGSGQSMTGLRSMELLDMDGDGVLDAVTDTGVYLGDGSGVFTQAQAWPVPSGAGLMVATAGDVDGNGAPDTVLGFRSNSFDGWPNQLWLAGTSGLSDSGARLGNNDSGALALGDVDGDGDLDLLVGNSGNEPVTRYLNDPQAAGGGARSIPVLHPGALFLLGLALAGAVLTGRVGRRR